MANPANAVWFKAYDKNNNIRGFVCLTINKTLTARFKSDFVLTGYRNRGIYKILFAARMNYAKHTKLKKATAFCTPLSYPTYIKNGFTPKKKYKSDIIFVERVF